MKMFWDETVFLDESVLVDESGFESGIGMKVFWMKFSRLG